MLVVAEKPSVARDIARALGVAAQGRTFFEGPSHVITWCVGHLVELDEPAAYDARWKVWRLDTLPMIPERFKLRISTGAPEQFRAVRALLRDDSFASVVNACDAGREGELIFRYVYELSGSRIRMLRLWVNALTDEALTKAFARLEPGARYDRLADAARCRSEADWLVGLNATRAVTARARQGADRTLYSIGRVQTPTLALIVHRDDAIATFVPKDYLQIEGHFTTQRAAQFRALWTHVSGARLANESLANAVISRCETAALRAKDTQPVVETVRTQRTREPPPLLFDLTSLQRTANKRYGLSASRTLEIAQALYEKHKLLTYPRTDSRYLTRDTIPQLPTIFRALANVPVYTAFAQPFVADPPAPRRVFNDGKVSDHHAIIPTGRAVPASGLSPDESKLFDLVARRFIAAFCADAEFDDTHIVVRVGAPVSVTTQRTPPQESNADGPTILDALPPPPDRFVTRGRVKIAAGWQQVAGIDRDDAAPSKRKPRDDVDDAQEDTDERARDLPLLVEGERLSARYQPLKKQTRPPQRYSEATLLGAMETAGRTIDDDALRDAMRDRGLGTPATRANVIETLITRGFIKRDRRVVVATPLGSGLVHALPIAALTSAEMTGEWEARLNQIERGEDTRAAFMRDIASFVREAVDTVRAAPLSVQPPETTATAEVIGRCPRCGSSVVNRTADYGCAVGPAPCGLSIPKRLAQREISSDLAAVLLRHRSTRELRGFTSRAGKSFSAALQLLDDGTLSFVFASGARGSSDAPEAPAPAPERRARAERSTARDAANSPAAPKRVASPSGSKVLKKSPEGATASIALEALQCPRCGLASLVTGNRGWGCARWREGCKFVLWFEVAGRKLTAGQVEQLVSKGRTRTGVFRPGNGPPVKGKLVLDLTRDDGAAVFVPAPREEA